MNSALWRRYFECLNFNFNRFSLILDVFLVQNQLLYSYATQCTVFPLRIQWVGAPMVAWPCQFHEKTLINCCIHPARSSRGRREMSWGLEVHRVPLTASNEGIFGSAAVLWHCTGRQNRQPPTIKSDPRCTQVAEIMILLTCCFIDTSCKHLTKTSHTVFYGPELNSMRTHRCNLASWPSDFPLATVEKADTNEAKWQVKFHIDQKSRACTMAFGLDWVEYSAL